MVFTVFNLVEALWFIIPAFAANGMAPLAGLLRKTHPIDKDNKPGGRRLLGDGKSWEGLAIGVLAAVLVATFMMLMEPYLPWDISEQLLNIAPMSPLLGFALGIGAMLGDIGGSFIKRRFGRDRGAPVPLLDQLDFMIGAFLVGALVVAVELEWFIILAILTPVLHLLANVIGYRIGVKKTPW